MPQKSAGQLGAARNAELTTTVAEFLDCLCELRGLDDARRYVQATHKRKLVRELGREPTRAQVRERWKGPAEWYGERWGRLEYNEAQIRVSLRLNPLIEALAAAAEKCGLDSTPLRRLQQTHDRRAIDRAEITAQRTVSRAELASADDKRTGKARSAKRRGGTKGNRTPRHSEVLSPKQSEAYAAWLRLHSERRVADELRISPSAVHKRIDRARAKLKPALRGRSVPTIALPTDSRGQAHDCPKPKRASSADD